MIHGSSPLRWLVLVLAILVSGCAPSDPLEIKISASDGDVFLRWMKATSPKLPPGVETELARSIVKISARTVRLPSETDPLGEALCKKIDGISIRNAIIDGYEAENEQLMLRLLLDQENQLKTLNQLDSPAPAFSRQDLQARVDREAKIMDSIRQRLAANRARISELSK